MAADGIVSKADFARLLGVSGGMVTKHLKAGRLVLSEDGKRVNAAASLALIKRTVDPARGGKGGNNGRALQGSADPAVAEIERPPVERTGPSFNQVRTEREAYSVKQAELDYGERVGKYIEKEKVDRALVDGLTPIMSALDSLSARIAPALCAESDPRKVENIIDAAIATIRQEMADTLRRMVSGATGTRQ